MKVSNNLLKEQQINWGNTENKVNKTYFAHSQSFKGVGDIIIQTMDGIDRGGLVASFLVQDFFGVNIPRTAKGLYRNREITNEYNYQEAAEVAIREFVTGPSMFAVPMLMLWGIKKYLGKANDVPVEMIKALGEKFGKHLEGKSSTEIGDINTIKKSFYIDLFKDALTNATNGNMDEKAIQEKATNYADTLLKAETAPKKPFFKKLAGKPVEGSAEDLMSSLVDDFAKIRKQNALNASENFLQATIKTQAGDVNKGLAGMATDARNYIEDIFNVITKKTKDGAMDSAKLQKFISDFSSRRAGSRVLTNISMILGIIGFCSIVPKLYQLSDKNPGLNGLPSGQQTNNTQDKSNNKQVAFKGGLASLGNAVAKKGGFFNKLHGGFEFDSFNTSHLGLLLTCVLGVIVPRLVHAREENEYKEVMFRDTTTVATMVFAAKACQQIFSKICAKASGFALANIPHSKDDSIFKKVFNYIRPKKGVQVLTSDQLATKYTNINEYKDGLYGFANFVNDQGGNVRKMFKVDKNASNLLETLYNASTTASTTEYAKATNKEVLSAIKEVMDGHKADDTLNQIYEIFKKGDNAFLRKAKLMNSTFNFVTLFAVVPLLLGYMIPKMNEVYTKKRQEEKSQNLAINEGSNAQQKSNKTLHSVFQGTGLQANSKINQVFKEFVNAR